MLHEIKNTNPYLLRIKIKLTNHYASRIKIKNTYPYAPSIILMLMRLCSCAYVYALMFMRLCLCLCVYAYASRKTKRTLCGDKQGKAHFLRWRARQSALYAVTSKAKRTLCGDNKSHISLDLLTTLLYIFMSWLTNSLMLETFKNNSFIWLLTHNIDTIYCLQIFSTLDFLHRIHRCSDWGRSESDWSIISLRPFSRNHRRKRVL